MIMRDMLTYEVVQLNKLHSEELKLKKQYIAYSEQTTDAQLKEKLQKCAAVHSGNISILEKLTGKTDE